MARGDAPRNDGAITTVVDDGCMLQHMRQNRHIVIY